MGNPIANNKVTALMTKNGMSTNRKEKALNLHKSRARSIVKTALGAGIGALTGYLAEQGFSWMGLDLGFMVASGAGMGVFSALDYFSNCILTVANYSNVRFYSGKAIPKGFYTMRQIRIAFRKAGLSDAQAKAAYRMCATTLWDAYTVQNGVARLRSKYAQYVTD